MFQICQKVSRGLWEVVTICKQSIM
jgi:hypothetical protein